MKKKILALCLVVVLAITAVTGVTLAYFTDTETADNVFVVGEVDIELYEEFPNDVLVPGTREQNALQKEIYVTNKGMNDAYMWVEILIPSALDDGNTLNNPAPGIGNNLHMNYYDTYIENGEEILCSRAYAEANGLGEPVHVIDMVWMGEVQDEHGVYYNKYINFDHNGKALPKGETTPALLAQVYMDKKVTQCETEGHADNCVVLMDGTTHYDGTWELLVKAVGFQADGFETLGAALKEYYGKEIIE